MKAKLTNKNTHRKSCKCKECGQPETLRKRLGQIVSNISHALGLCADCVGKQAGL